MNSFAVGGRIMGTPYIGYISEMEGNGGYYGKIESLLHKYEDII